MDLDLDPLMAAGSDLTSLEFASLRNWELGGTAALQGFGLGLGDSDLGSASGLWLSPPLLPRPVVGGRFPLLAFCFLIFFFSDHFFVLLL